ncbi:MAG: toprim domain-containing protein [Actinomycetota bacterium]|nr:toprim domain-containing protein [Actinomycetota bacterium]
MGMISEAKARHSLAEVARRTGIPVPEGATGDVKVQCPMPYPDTDGEVPPANAKRAMLLHLDDGMWYCFACAGRGMPATGDVIQWVQNLESCSVPDAVAKLDSGSAIKNHWPPHPSGHPPHHVPVSRRNSSEAPDLERTSRERVLEVIDISWRYYSGGRRHTKGGEYLDGRGIDVSVLEDHTGRPEIGHTPEDPRAFLMHMVDRDVTDDELVDAGLVYRWPSGGVTAFFRNRCLIPCRNDDGNVVGYFGRDVSGKRIHDKYVNPSRTLVYTKSINMYRPLPWPITPHGQVIVVEGTLDALAISISAIKERVQDTFCPVTQSGKSLSDVQLDKVLAKTPKPPVVAFDGDDAGRAANITLARRIIERGRECVVTDLPDGMDSVEYLGEYGAEGLAAWTRWGALKADGESIRPVYGPAFVVSQTWRTEFAKAMEASEDDNVDWAELLAKVEEKGVRMRAQLPASAHVRYDTQAAKVLAPNVAFEAVRFVKEQLDESLDEVESTDPAVAARARATAVADRSRKWLSRFPKADIAKVEPVLSAELVRAAGDDPEMAALLPEAVENFSKKPRQAHQLTEMGHWEPPLIEPPEAIGM